MAVTIDGLDSLQKDMQKLQDQLGSGAGPVVSEALNAGADIMLAEIQSNARSELNLGSKRNALYPSLQKGRVKSRASGGSTIEIGSFMSALRAEIFYAGFVEFGHGGPAPAPPHPFVRPAFDTKVEEAYRAMKQVLETGITI